MNAPIPIFLEALLAPVSMELPGGSNLEYDADFLALEQAVAGKPEEQYGSTLIAAEAPDWSQVERLALALHARTRDLRVMVHLCHAWTQRRGLAGYLEGLQLIEETLRRHGPHVFPPLEVDGELDSFFRSNALAALGDQAELGRTVQGAALLQGAGGDISLGDACALLDRSKAECAAFPGGRTRLVDALSRPDEPARGTVRALARAIESLRDCIEQQPGDLNPPGMDVLRKNVATLLGVIDQEAQRPEDEATAAAETLSGGTAPPRPQGNEGYRDGPIRTREEAMRALGRVQAYFRQHEPSHPAPLMLERVQRIAALDFLEILQDLAPDCLGPVRTILGSSGEKI